MPRTPHGFDAGTSGTSRRETGTSRLAQGSGAASIRSMAYADLGTSGTSGTLFARFRVCARDGVWGYGGTVSAKPVSVRRSEFTSLTSLTSLNGKQPIENKGLALCASILPDVPENKRDVPDVPNRSASESRGSGKAEEMHNILRKAA